MSAFSGGRSVPSSPVKSLSKLRRTTSSPGPPLALAALAISQTPATVNAPPQPRPPPGVLQFDSNFPSGSLGLVTPSLDHFEYNISIRSDSKNPKYSVWFYFRIRNTKSHQKLIFHLYNYSKSRSLYSKGFSPVIRSSHGKWREIPKENIQFIKECTKHSAINPLYSSSSSSSSLSTSSSSSLHSPPVCHGFGCICLYLQFSNEGEEYFLASSIPYTNEDLEDFIGKISLQGKSIPYLEKRVIATSHYGKSFYLLKITGPSGFSSSTPSPAATKGNSMKNNSMIPSGKQKKKFSIVITGRVHPGETGSSFVIEGIINFLLSGMAENPSAIASSTTEEFSNPPPINLIAQSLLSHVTFYFIPILNPDGIELGNYRTNAYGYDLNRVWNFPHREKHYEIYTIKQYLLEQLLPEIQSSSSSSSLSSSSSSSSQVLDFFFDFHTHSTKMGCFLYGNQNVSMKFPSLLGEYYPQYFYWDTPPASSGASNAVNPLAHNRNQSMENSSSAGTVNSTRDPGWSDLLEKTINGPENSAAPVLPAASPLFSQNNQQKKGTSRMALGEILQDSRTQCFTVECSVFGSEYRIGPDGKPVFSSSSSSSTGDNSSDPPCVLRYTSDHYREIGRGFCETLYRYFKLEEIDEGKSLNNSAASETTKPKAPAQRRPSPNIAGKRLPVIVPAQSSLKNRSTSAPNGWKPMK